MKAPISPKNPVYAPPPRWSRWGSLLVLTALGAVVIARSRIAPGSPGKAASPARRENTGHVYENRALFRSPGPSAKPASERSSPVIFGTIYGIDGELIEGARVVANTFQTAGNLASSAGSAESDASGRFEIRVPEGSYYVNAAKEGYGPSLVQAASGDKVSLILPKSGVIEGHVYDEQRAPVQRFTIDLVSVTPDSVAAPAPLWSRSFTSPDGSFRITELPAYAVAVRATAPDKAPAYTPPTMVGAKETRSIDLVLSSGCALTGTVEDKKGNGLPGVFLDAEARVGQGSMMEASMAAPSQVNSDPQGHFRLDHVPLGAVLIRAYDGASAVTTAALDISSCDQIAPVKIVMSDGGSIAGVVRGDDGAPVPGVRLTVMHKAIGFVNALSDAEGRFRFDQIPASVVRLSAGREGRQLTQMVTVNEGGVTQQDITLLGAGKGEIRGRVTAGGKPLAGAQLMIAANYGGDKGMGTYYPMTGEDGSYRLPQISEGGYLVLVSSTFKVATVELKPGGVETVDLDVADKGGR